MVANDDLKRLLEKTRDHNVDATRITEVEYAALPNAHEVALRTILAGDDVPDRSSLDGYIHRVGDHRAPRLLNGLVQQGRVDLADNQMSGIVAGVWTLAEPFTSGIDAHEWIGMFRANRYSTDGKLCAAPNAPAALYRGCVPDRRLGMSWTTDYATAREFACSAMSGRRRGNIYRAVISPALMLAYINDELGRGESEYVVDQFGLEPDSVALVATGDEICP